jgi:hypothetical protein
MDNTSGEIPDTAAAVIVTDLYRKFEEAKKNLPGDRPGRKRP